MEATPNGEGYWLVGPDGAMDGYGDAVVGPWWNDHPSYVVDVASTAPPTLSDPEAGKVRRLDRPIGEIRPAAVQA